MRELSIQRRPNTAFSLETALKRTILSINEEG